MEIYGNLSVRTDMSIWSGRLILEPGSNRVVLEQSKSTGFAGLIELDPKEPRLKLCLNINPDPTKRTTPLGFVTGSDNWNRLQVFKKDDGAKDSRPR